MDGLMISKGLIASFLGLCLGGCGVGNGVALEETHTFEQASFQFSQVRTVSVSDSFSLWDDGFITLDNGECGYFVSYPYLEQPYGELRKITKDGQDQLLFSLDGMIITAAQWDQTANQFVIGTIVETEELEETAHFLSAYDKSGNFLWKDKVTGPIIDLNLVNQRYRVRLGPLIVDVIDLKNPAEAKNFFKETISDTRIVHDSEFDQTRRYCGEVFYESNFQPYVFVRGQEELVLGSRIDGIYSQIAVLLDSLEKGEKKMVQLFQSGLISFPIDAIAVKENQIESIVVGRKLPGNKYTYSQYHIDLAKEEPSCTLGVTSAELESFLGEEICFMRLFQVNSDTILAGSYITGTQRSGDS